MRLVAFASLVLLLQGCFPNASEAEKVKTPELFFQQTYDVVQTTVYSSSCPENESIQDEDWEIRDAILGLSPFEPIGSFDVPQGKHIRYRVLDSHSTAGPNYHEMLVFEEGKLRIEQKSALSSSSYFYYSFVSKGVSDIIDDVTSRIEAKRSSLS
ncbi:MAG: hypothetical protein K6E59_01215 [Bacilli bacterium]|nr:hypothetical protein [Bacilli bacterium]